jgi:hypothetical protein
MRTLIYAREHDYCEWDFLVEEDLPIYNPGDRINVFDEEYYVYQLYLVKTLQGSYQKLYLGFADEYTDEMLAQLCEDWDD